MVSPHVSTVCAVRMFCSNNTHLHNVTYIGCDYLGAFNWGFMNPSFSIRTFDPMCLFRWKVQWSRCVFELNIVDGRSMGKIKTEVEHLIRNFIIPICNSALNLYIILLITCIIKIYKKLVEPLFRYLKCTVACTPRLHHHVFHQSE